MCLPLRLWLYNSTGPGNYWTMWQWRPEDIICPERERNFVWFPVYKYDAFRDWVSFFFWGDTQSCFHSGKRDSRIYFPFLPNSMAPDTEQENKILKSSYPYTLCCSFTPHQMIILHWSGFQSITVLQQKKVCVRKEFSISSVFQI